VLASRAFKPPSLKPDGKGVTVVGDDAQSIYSFRAATVRNILEFPHLLTRPAHIITLDRNYRSTQSILTAANAVIDLAAERYQKNLRSERSSAERPQLVSVRDETDQARYVAERILEHREAAIPLKQQAVLFRASHHSAPLEIELTRRNTPFVKFGGLKFLEAAHVKDVLAFLRFAENLRDRMSGFRVIQLSGRCRSGHCITAARPAGRGKQPTGSGDRIQTARFVRGALACLRRNFAPYAQQRRRLAGGIRSGVPVVSAASGTAFRRCQAARSRSSPAGPDCLDVSQPPTLPHRADAGSSIGNQR
jgi:superfamily I DNA/RNA helicase